MADLTKKRRRSIRLQTYDYTQPGIYYITICSHEKRRLFGAVRNGTMELNGYGKIVERCWTAIPEHFDGTGLGAFIIMPDHLHGILEMGLDPGNEVGARPVVPLRDNAGSGERFGQPVSGSLGTMIRSFKSAATKHINIARNTPGQPVWQRNYYEHIVRTDGDLEKITEYIRLNPVQWSTDGADTEFEW